MAAKYRSEIDGLRAIAVFFVIGFHFFPAKVPLGYLGVDLFFVISGYVITAQINRQLIDQSFSFIDFYTRRIKRILPVSFFVLFTVTFAGLFILMPGDFNSLVESAFASSMFLSNVYFWIDGGYFGGSDKLKPLLHMWSLSVEEQFYIFYPLLLWLAIKYLKIRPWIAILAVSLISFGLYSYLGSIGGQSPAFFLMPTRVWQFGLGGLAALIVAQSQGGQSRLISGIAFIILVSCFFSSLFRSSNEVVVTLAAAVFLVSSNQVAAAIRPLSVAPLTWMGLRSYSLYLWHWPIAAFLSYVFVQSIPFTAKLAGILLSVGLAEMSYRAIESPFRRKFGLTKSLSLIACSASGVAFLAIQPLFASRPLSFGDKLAEQAQTNFRCGISQFISYGASRACVLKPLSEKGNIAILGNSHAQMYALEIKKRIFHKKKGLLLVPLNSCIPTLTLNIDVECLDLAKQNFEAITADSQITTVIIGTTYSDKQYISNSGRLDGDGNNEKLAVALIDLVDRLENSGRDVWLIGPMQEPGYDLPSEIGRKLRFGQIAETEVGTFLGVPRADFDRRYGRMITLLKQRLGHRLLLPHHFLCDADRCRFANSNGSFFADASHLGKQGAATVGPIFDAMSQRTSDTD